jgi:hypothetical protein
MKKYITCTLLSISMSYIIHAQENVHPDITQISKPFTNFTQGSFKGRNLYFGSNWVKGRLLTSNNSVVGCDSFLFNFDKLERRLLITSDFKTMFEIDRREFKAVQFYWNDSAYIFKHIYFINDKDLFEVLVNDESRYSLFKVLRTKIIRGTISSMAAAGTNVLFPGGYLTDKYVDIVEYYISFPNRDYRSFFTIKKGALKRLFGLNPDSDKVNEFLSMIGDKKYDENDLIQLVTYLNKGSL